MTKLSILMPVYNEEKWISAIVEKVIPQHVEGVHSKELVIVDDCSKDSTRQILAGLAQKYPLIIKPIDR